MLRLNLRKKIKRMVGFRAVDLHTLYVQMEIYVTKVAVYSLFHLPYPRSHPEDIKNRAAFNFANGSHLIQNSYCFINLN